MLRMKTMALAFVVTAASMWMAPTDAQAGPLLDWIRGLRRPKCCAPTYNHGYAPQSNSCGLQPGQCMTTCQKTCSRTVVNYVPYTAYRTNWTRVPVTQYKPVTRTDSCSGCTVTCMRPCTNYTYQMQRVPYTTYRPVYRTETYKVPVTTITNGCYTGTCGTGTCGTNAPACNSCQTSFTPTAAQVPGSTVSGAYYEYPNSNGNPNNTIRTDGNFGPVNLPADTTPSLDGLNPQSYHRPVIERLGTGQINQASGTPVAPIRSNPSVLTFQEKTAQSPAQKRWSYSPVRLASHRSTTAPRTREPIRIQGTLQPIQRVDQNDQLNGWVKVK